MSTWHVIQFKKSNWDLDQVQKMYLFIIDVYLRRYVVTSQVVTSTHVHDTQLTLIIVLTSIIYLYTCSKPHPNAAYISPPTPTARRSWFIRPFYVQFACSLRACVGSLRVLGLPPTLQRQINW